jgi:hypothetical protein
MEESKNQIKRLEFDTSLLLDLLFNEPLGEVSQKVNSKAASPRRNLLRLRPSLGVAD